MKQNRREFITTIAAAGAAIPFTSSVLPGPSEAIKPRFPLRLFSKPLDNYDFGFMCECTALSGCGGFDLTVRPAGKIEPAEVETRLPLFINEAKKHNLVIDMLVTGIVNTTDPLTERVLKSASSLGVTHYRLGYLEFDYKAGVWESLQKHKSAFKDISAMNAKYKIHGDYQNHAGARVGGPVWDLYELMRELPPENIGCQYDVRHAMVEGTNAWIIGMRLISRYIKSLAIKDYTWSTVKGRPAAVTVPMGEGIVNWDLFFRTVKELDLSGPMTLHVEYPLLAKEEMDIPLLRQQEIIVGKIKKDVDFINSYLLKYQLT
jgi:sugar phosphate isomerase/epimerase